MLEKSRGFTLIEMMIVITIIGILAAIALPAYNDYIKRGYVSEGFILAGSAKTGIVEFYTSQGAFPNGTGSANSAIGLAPPTSITGDSVSKIEVLDDGSGQVEVTYKSKVDPINNTLVLKPTTSSASVAWDWVCSGGTTVNSRYLPVYCRH